MASPPVRPIRMSHRPFGLLEFGSKSLKFYLVEGLQSPGSLPTIRTCKLQWRVAHDSFATGRLSEETIGEILECVRCVERVSQGVPLTSMVAVATGVFREVHGVKALASRLQSETGLRLRVISGEDEARLMAKDFLKRRGLVSAYVFDLGGATTEWALIEAGSIDHWGSLPLGAIRQQHFFKHLQGDPASYLKETAAGCDGCLKELPVSPDKQIVVTGGTAKSAAKCLRSPVSLERVRQLIEQTLREGAPEFLTPSRQEVFLPGLVILWRVLVHCQADAFEHDSTSVKRGLAGRLARSLKTYRPEDLHATLLLKTTSLKKEGS